MTLTKRISMEISHKTTLGVTGTYIYTFHNKMHNSLHDFGGVQYQCLRESPTPYLSSIYHNNYVWIISYLTHKS